MNWQWCICPECGTGFSGMSPGEPCSQQCRAKRDIRRRSLIPDSSNPSAGRGSGGRAPTPSDGWCDITLGAVAKAMVVAAATALMNRVRR